MKKIIAVVVLGSSSVGLSATIAPPNPKFVDRGIYIGKTCILNTLSIVNGTYVSNEVKMPIPNASNFAATTKNCFEVIENRDQCWRNEFISPNANSLCVSLSPALGIPAHMAVGHCEYELKNCLAGDKWFARTEKAYYDYQVAEYKKELKKLADDFAKSATADKKAATDKLVAQLGVCLKATNDKNEVKQCYVKFRDAYMSL